MVCGVAFVMASRLFEINGKVLVRGVHAGVSKSVSDGAEVDA
jgi:hypothetical protein